MGCSCWNSPPEPVVHRDRHQKRAFERALDLHLKKGHTQSLLSRMGVAASDQEEALSCLRSWLFSGGPLHVDEPTGRYRLPIPRHPDEADPSGLLDKAWHALILSDLSWYTQWTKRLYGHMLNHVERTQE